MFLFFAALACAPPAPVATPASVSAAGYEPVSFDLSAVSLGAEVVEVRVAGLLAYDLVRDGDVVTVTIQGAPQPGPAEVAFSLADGSTVVFDEVLDVEAPAHDVGELWSLGASVAMGAQAGTVTQRGQLRAPGPLVARQLGVFHPLPLLVPGLLPGIAAADIGPAPACAIPDLDRVATSAATHALGQMEDPDEGGPNLRLGRVDPDLVPQNLAVAGTALRELANGYADEDFGQQFLAHLALEPSGELFDPVTATQLGALQTGEPGVILLPDFIGNDLIDAILASDVLDPSLSRDPEQVGAYLDTVIDTLAATGADVFAANMPLLSTTPLAMERARYMVASGSTEEEVRDLLDAIDRKVEVLNTTLADAVERHPNVHLVDAASQVNAVADGVQVGDETLSTQKFGGLISTDGVHFSDTGSAMLANAFIVAINEELGLDVPLVDLVAVLETDPFSPHNLDAAGVDVSGCDTGVVPSGR